MPAAADQPAAQDALADVLRQVKRIELRTNRLVSSLAAGPYRSAFRGQGMAFEEVREYSPGDDVRQIDWNVTARARDRPTSRSSARSASSASPC